MDAMSPDFDRRGLSGMGERSTQHAATHCAYGNKGLACGILSGKVVKVAGLSLPWADELEADGVLKDNWNIAKNWTPESRYQATRGAQEAQDYYSAVADTNSGVVKCIERFW